MLLNLAIVLVPPHTGPRGLRAKSAVDYEQNHPLAAEVGGVFSSYAKRREVAKDGMLTLLHLR